MADRPASEIARETLKQLAARRLPPTPDNYRALYEEIAGVRGPAPFPEAGLRSILRVMPAQTPAQKRLLEQFERAVTQKDWALLQSTLVGYANQGLSAVATVAVAADGPDNAAEPSVLPEEFAQLLARLVETTLPALGEEDVRIHEMAQQLTAFLRSPRPSIATAQQMLGNFSYRLSFTTEEQAAIRERLLELLHMVFENIAVLSANDLWLQGQAEALKAATTPPITLRRLDGVQRRLKDVIIKQAQAHGRSLEAQEQMKALLASFIERLAKMTVASDVYHETLERCATQIGQATTLEEIAPVLQEAMQATRSMALDSRLIHAELEDLRIRTEQRQAEIVRLQEELAQVSEQVRHDPLTGALNRKGLDEAMEREIARARRLGAPLCLALLDLDNFKELNDRLGHVTGDAALVHLAEVTRSVMRSQDLLGRYGGEEFVLLLPDTALESGVEAMKRLQRELSTRLFMQGKEKVLITFSAGVVQLQDTETSAEALLRADAAMYLAKRAGKNRVVAA
jgi:diguanylate cyclase